MNKKDIPDWYLNLSTEVPITSFTFQGNTHSLLEVEASVFDAWISPYFEDITDVDRSTWSKFHRWKIVNKLLEDGDLQKQKNEDGSFFLLETPETEEETSSEVTDKPTLEAAVS